MAWTIGVVCPRQKSSARQEFTHDLATGEDESFLEENPPCLQIVRMVQLEPSQERTVIASQPEDAFCVFDGGRDFQTVANDACICEESRNVIITKGRDRLGFEARIGPFETLALFQDCFPRQPCLVDFEDQTLEKLIVMQKRKSVLEVVVARVNCV